MTGASMDAQHGALMDSVYRFQRHIYDATRKFFLFGRDSLIAGLDLPASGSVLEVACGTGRNLALVRRRWPGARLFGFDISAEMLKSARAKLGDSAHLAEGDACAFTPQGLFGESGFDRVMISFALSMIPDWRAALERGAEALTPGGELHVVDFGDCAGLPAPLRAALQAWLRHFHVTPRADLPEAASDLADRLGLTLRHRRGPLGYFRIVVLARPA